MGHPRHMWLRQEDGAIAVLVALLMTVLLGMGALAIDIASFRLTQRQLQAATDAAALAGTYGLAPNAPNTDPQTWVTKYLRLNYPGIKKPTAQLPQIGYYCPNASIAVPAKRFSQTDNTCAVYPVSGGTTAHAIPEPNAVRVNSQVESPLYLGRVLMPGKDGVKITATATAAQIPQAGFYAGSGLLSLDKGLINAVLGGLLGSNVSLDAVSYNGLLNTNISTLAFLQQLATVIGISAGTYSDLLNSNVTVQQVIQAQIGVLNGMASTPDSVAALNALSLLQGQISGSPNLQLSDLFDLGMWQSEGRDSVNTKTALQTTLNAFQLTSLTAQVANGSNFISLPSFSTSVLGLATLTVAASLIEKPQHPPFVLGPVGMEVHTSQVRLKLDLNVPVPAALQLVLGHNAVQLPLYVEVAKGDAKLTQIDCGSGSPDPSTVTIDATPGLATAYIGDVGNDPMHDFTTPIVPSPATLVNVLHLVTVTGDATVSSGPSAPTPLVFSFTQPIDRTIPPTTHTATSNNALLASLLPRLIDTGLHVKLGLLGLGLGLKTTIVSSALSTLLSPVFNGLDQVIGQVLDTLGIQIGYLDVTATGVRCNAPALVN